MDQIKKSNKWSCKICFLSQTVRTLYSHGTAQNCRKEVQQLNMIFNEKVNEAKEELENLRLARNFPVSSLRESQNVSCKRSHEYDEISDDYKKLTKLSRLEIKHDMKPDVENPVSKWNKFI